MKKIKIAITGHRPSKLNNEYNLDGPISEYIRSKIIIILDKIEENRCEIDYLISGMALGVDTLFALLAFRRGIKLIAAIPFEGQEKVWPQSSKSNYSLILNNPLTTKKFISEPGYATWKMQKRNEWMVDNCDLLIAVWDGSEGGTANCVKYAKKVKKPILHINPLNFKQ